MKISIDNIGHVRSANIDVNSITVIAGNNNTGKSTVGKVLYATATGLNLLEPLKILEEKLEAVSLRLSSLLNIIELDDIEENLLMEIRRFCFRQDFLNIDDMINPQSIDNSVSLELTSQINTFFEKIKENQSEEKQPILQLVHHDIMRLLDRSINDKGFKINIMQKVFGMEFLQQISHLNNPEDSSKITVKELNQNEINVILKDHKIVSEGTTLDISRTFSKAIYIDNPFILDRKEHPIFRSRNQYAHTEALQKILLSEESLYENNLFDLDDRESKIDHIFNHVLNEGKILKREGKHYFESSNIKKPLAFQNLSTGLKSFSIINMLLKSKHLNKCEYIILDEPEIHLHPDWQINFAELVVLMSKEFNLKVIVTSHSPYFIEAIELFSKKHKYFNDVKFYKTVGTKDGNHIITDYTDNVSQLYDDLAKAFYVLEELRANIEDGEDYYD